MSNIQQVGGGGGSGPGPIDNDRPLTQMQMKTIKDLIAKSRDLANTNNQTKVVQQLWDNLRPAVVARYMVLPPDIGPVVARYMVPRPDSDVGMPGGAFDPERYDGTSGVGLANLADTRDVGATDEDGNFRFPDDSMVMYYLVAPPPPDPKHKPRYETLRAMDQDMNKTFGALLDTAEKVIKDGTINDGEMTEFSRLHYAFDLCAKLFYDNLTEYQKDFRFSPSPEEHDPGAFRRFSGDDAVVTPPTVDTPRPTSDAPSSLLGVQSAQLKKDD